MPAGSVKGGGALACHAEGVTSEVRTERRGGDTLESPGGSTFRAEAEALGAAGGPRAGSEEQARRLAWRSHRASRAQPRRCLPPEMQEIQEEGAGSQHLVRRTARTGGQVQKRDLGPEPGGHQENKFLPGGPMTSVTQRRVSC